MFFLSIFGYLVFMIMFKWATVWPGGNGPPLLNTLINMFMSPGTLTDPPLYDGQAAVQNALLVLAFISVPLLLIPKPIIGYMQHRKVTRAAAASNYSRMIRESFQPTHDAEPIIPSTQPAPVATVAEEEEEYSFTDEFVHQVRGTGSAVPGPLRSQLSARRAGGAGHSHY